MGIFCLTLNTKKVNLQFRTLQLEENMNGDCVFCDRAKFADQLIDEDKDWYVVATLGQIIGGYVLIIPKIHIPCMGALSSGQTKSALQMVKKVCRALSLEYLPRDAAIPYSVTVFEHGIVGQTIKHAHLHLLPASIDLTPRMHADFPNATFEELRHVGYLQELYGRHPRPYLFWTNQSGKSLVCWDPPAPAQYLRLVAAELLGFPERGNWHDMDPELDKKLGEETVVRLRPYFS